MNNQHPNPSGFGHDPGQTLQYSFMSPDHMNPMNGIPPIVNGQHVYHHTVLEDIPDVEAYERNLRIDLPTFSLANMSNVPQNTVSHMPAQITPHVQQHVPQFQPLLPPAQLQSQVQQQQSFRFQNMDHAHSSSPDPSFVQPPRSHVSQDFTTLVGKLEIKSQEGVKNRQMPMKFITPKTEVVDDQTPMMSPVSTSAKMHRNGIKPEIQVTLDPDGLDEDPEPGVDYPEPVLFDLKTTIMTEYELDLLKHKQFGIENSKKLEVPDASAPPNKIVEFLMYNRTLKEGELQQINCFRTKRKRLSLNHQKINPDREFDQKACESLVKKLKDKKHDLQNLLDVVHSKGKKFTGCITIPRTLDGRLQVHGRKGFPHVVYGKLWRFSDMTKNETRHLDHCKHAFEMKSDLVCVNPYHYEIVTGQMVVGSRESHDSKDMNSSHATPRYSAANVGRAPSMDDAPSRYNPHQIRSSQAQPIMPPTSMYQNPFPPQNRVPQMPSFGVPTSYASSSQYFPPPPPPQGYDIRTSSANPMMHQHAPPQQDPQYAYGFSQYQPTYQIQQQPSTSNYQPPSYSSWDHPPTDMPSTSNGISHNFPGHPVFNDQMQLNGNTMHDGLYAFNHLQHQHPQEQFPQNQHLQEQHSQYSDPKTNNNPNFNDWQKRADPTDTPIPNNQPNINSQIDEGKSVSLTNFRKFCMKAFGSDFFKNAAFVLVDQPIDLEKCVKVKDRDILCVDQFRAKLKKGESLEHPLSPNGPYGDLCHFISTLSFDKILMNGEEPETATENGVWGTVIYYEENKWIGEKKMKRGNYHVDGGFISSDHRYSLGFEENNTRSDAAYKVRAAIIDGIRFSYKTDRSVWIQNNMTHPIFVTSGYLDEQSGGLQQNKVHKVFGHGKLKVFGFEQCTQAIGLRLCSRTFSRMFMRGEKSNMTEAYKTRDMKDIRKEANRSHDDLAKYCCVKISFCKGFGPAYPKKEIKECPVWLELKVLSAYEYMDNLLGSLAYNFNDQLTLEELQGVISIDQ